MGEKETLVRRREKRERTSAPPQVKPPRSHKRKASKETSSLLLPFLSFLVCASGLTIFYFVYADQVFWTLVHKIVDDFAKNVGYHKPVYALVLDAGSTASRIHAFTLHRAVLDGHLVLDKSFFHEIKPGLSSFASSPQKGVDSVKQLVEAAQKEIPEIYWKSTPIVLKATAGLRLLPQEHADNLLNAVREFFKTLPHLNDENAVSIMDGEDEGVFSWFTVNFLRNLLNGKHDQTVAALDLGGGSTQVTFAPSTPATLSQKKLIHTVKVPSGTIQVYTKSYLGLGLNEARKEILIAGSGNATTVYSECINPSIQKKHWHYHGTDYVISGPKKTTTRKVNVPGSNKPEEIPVVSFEKCSKIVHSYVLSKMIPPDELKTKRICAFSYYFDRAVDAGLINPNTGGVITVEEFKNAAKKICDEVDADQPFLCLDLIYIWDLLEHGLGLDPHTKLGLFKKVYGHEVSWALGVAFDTLK